MLYAGLMFFGVFFLVRVHYLFLAQSEATSVYQFGTSEIALGLVSSIASVFKQQSANLLVIGAEMRYSEVMVMVGLLSVLGLAVLVPAIVLLYVAQRSRGRNGLLLTAGDPRAVNPHRPEPARQQALLSRMEVWPLRYPKPVTLVAIAVVAAAAFFFYKLTLVLVGFVIFVCVKSVSRLLQGLGGQPASSTSKGTSDATAGKASAGD
jgi:hypothetical protein